MSRMFDDFLQEQLRDPEIRKEYEALQPEHMVIQAMLDARKKSGMTQKELALKYTFDEIISKTIRNQRHKVEKYNSVMDIWNIKAATLEKKTWLVAHLPKEKISIDELETVLKNLFEQNRNILYEETTPVKTNIRRLILIYDYLKWGKRKEPSD